MPDIIFSSILAELKTAIENNEHPFRYFTLATTDINSTPRLRTVVLRNIDKDLNFIIYTDQRSKKIIEIKQHKGVGILFYDPKRLLQITIRATATIITDQSILTSIWNQIPQGSRKSYTTEFPPGKEIDNPEKMNYLKNTHFFSAIKIIPEQIEYLRLKRPNHIRLLFKKENNEWKGNYITP